MIDAARHRQTGAGAADHLRLMAELAADEDSDPPIPDDRLSLMFACAHPAIDVGIRAPLILQTILGFDAATIASAFLVSPATMGQRLVRAKNKIRAGRHPVPGARARRAARAPGRGARGDLRRVRRRLVRSRRHRGPPPQPRRRSDLARAGWWPRSCPEEPEALGLLSLMLHAEARRGARRGACGEYVPLAEQDPAAWDARLIDEAEALLFRASAHGATGRYQLEAAVQSAHVVRRRTGRSDWAAIERLYDALSAITGSPVVAINRAIALAETRGAAAGLAALDALADDARLADYQPYWAARAGLLARSGEAEAADQAYQRAIGLESDPAVRGSCSSAARNCARGPEAMPASPSARCVRSRGRPGAPASWPHR